jgi:hypothetical protein
MLIRVGEQVQAEFFTTGIQRLFGLELHNQLKELWTSGDYDWI